MDTLKYLLAHLDCARCARRYHAQQLLNRCECGGTLLARYDLSGIDLERVRARRAGLWRYRELLPVQGEPVSLSELETPLVPLRRLSERWGVEVWMKDDGPLPGGTFKARGAAVGVTRAKELGAPSLVMPSAGNAGGAWALYAARARLPLTVTMAKTAPRMNQDEVRLAGADLRLVDGTIADAGAAAKEHAASSGAYLSATFNEPYRVEGKKTAWLETYDRLGDDKAMRLPGTIVLPVGGGVAAVAAAKAAGEVRELGWTGDPAPKLVGVQPEDCAPLVRAFEQGLQKPEPWDGAPSTIAAGLRVPSPGEGDLVLDRIRTSGGTMRAVSDEQIVDAIRLLASEEGILACPEGAATVAALEADRADLDLRGPVVLYNTGTGAKYLEVLRPLLDDARS